MVQANYNVAIVILNYLNYKDTIECVNSILDMKYRISGIVIVDNGSTNESYSVLKKFYIHVPHVYTINTKKNLGYAKGNNYGITFARKKLKAQFVLCANNDTLFTNADYLDKLLGRYEKGVGMLGSKIIIKDGKEQALVREYLNVTDTLSVVVNAWSAKRGSSFDFSCSQGSSVYTLHGCALLFSPDFFKYYKGYYNRTFLYGEEPILRLMCDCKGLKQVYVAETSIYHKESQSSEMSFDNDNSIKRKYSGQSRKYVFYWTLKYYIMKKLHMI